MTTILLFILLLLSSTAEAATYYVATTGNDSTGTGSSGSPWLTIQKAANAALVAGDTVFIRGGTYASTSVISFSHSGSAGNLITWKPDPGTGTPIIRYNGSQTWNTGIMELRGVSYNRFEGLTFGGPSGSILNSAIIITGTNSSIDFITTHSNGRGDQIVGNTFQNIGVLGNTGTAISTYPGVIFTGLAEDLLVDSNTFTGNYGINIWESVDSNSTITNNTISGMHAACFYDGCISPNVPNAHGTWFASDFNAFPVTWSPGSTLRAGGYALVQGNTIDGSGIGSFEASGIRCDAGSHNMTVKNNVVKNMGTTADSAGIYMESRCHNNLIVGNTVTASNRGILLGNASSGANSRYDTIVNNTLSGNVYGFYSKNGGNNLIANNIGVENTSSQVIISQLSVTLGSNVLKNNDWWRSTTTNIGMWNCSDAACDAGPANLTAANFNSASGQSASLSQDPLFVSTSDFHLQAGSPVIDHGSNSLSTATISYTPTFAGTAPDMGAFETGSGTVTWTSDRGGAGTPNGPNSGTASGTANWTASIPLSPGINNITVTATDTSGNAGSATRQVIYAPVFPGNTLEGSWAFNEVGSTAVESSGNGNTGSLQNSPTRITGKYDNGILLNGTNQYISANDSNSLHFTQSFTFALWVKPTAQHTDWRAVLVKDPVYLYASSDSSSCANGGPVLEITTNGILGPLTDLCYPVALFVGNWNHLAGTYDNTAGLLTIYVNGVQAIQTKVSGYMEPNTTQPLYMGRSQYPTEYFDGAIDEPHVYNFALPLSLASNTTPNATCTAQNRTDQNGTDPTKWSIIGAMNCSIINPAPPLPIKFPASASGLKVGSAASLKFGTQ